MKIIILAFAILSISQTINASVMHRYTSEFLFMLDGGGSGGGTITTTFSCVGDQLYVNGKKKSSYSFCFGNEQRIATCKNGTLTLKRTASTVCAPI